MSHLQYMGRLMLPGAALLVGLLLLGCDDGPPPKKDEATPKAEAVPKMVAPVAGPAKQEKVEKVEMVLTEKDFVERMDNRDPFHSFILRVGTNTRRADRRQRKVVLKRYALDELKLIAVVTGQTRPLAMFRDPKGLGVPVKRGDYISKSEGRVKQILSDKVIVEIEASAESKRSRSDTVIPLHTKAQ